MKVTILDATEKPIDIISIAAGTSTRRYNVSEKRVNHCVSLGHHSILEFADMTCRIEGVSRTLMAQITRHRMASYCIESQRYNKYDFNNEDWYVIPPAIAADVHRLQCYRNTMGFAAQQYHKLLDDGVKPEDARFVLPESTKTTITMKMNCSSLFNFFNLRLSPKSQWEVQECAQAIKKALSEYSEQWSQMMELYDEKCTNLVMQNEKFYLKYDCR